MSALLATLDRVATPRGVVVLLALELLVLVGENTLTFPLSVPYFRHLTGHDYLDMCAFCSPAVIYSRLDAFGASGRQLQLLLFATVDVVIPTLSGLFGVLGLSLLTRPWREVHPQLRWLVLVPVVAASLDFTENALITLLTTRYPDRLETLAGVSGIVTGLKFGAYLLMGLLLAVFSVLHVTRSRRT
jgi:hypothetical protein